MFRTQSLRLSMATFVLFGGIAGAQQTTTVHDATPLRPPPGARVAIVEFEDMECPDCGRANPLLKDAAAQYKIPWIRHDFPLQFHAWSFDAAVYARWFDTKSKKLGDDFRDEVFANQNLINAAAETSPETPSGPSAQAAAAIHNFAEKFAQAHGVELPFVVDPQKKLAALVQADLDLGKRVGIEHTPTIWVVTNKTNGVPFVEVVDRQRLYQIIDQALSETKATAPAHKGAGE
jgi:protein-disulfide isomerase